MNAERTAAVVRAEHRLESRRSKRRLSKWTWLELALLGLCLIAPQVDGRILVIRRETNQIIEEFNDLPAAFGPSLPVNGMKLYAIEARPPLLDFFQSDNFGCSKIANPPADYPKNAKFVAIIQRGNCSFEQKVRMAQAAAFHAAIIYNDDGDNLEQMSAENASGIRIPSVFVGQSSGENLLGFFPHEIMVVINDELPFNINTQLILPFAILIGLCFLIMIFYMVYKCIREERRLRRNLLPKKVLKKLPILTLTKNSNYLNDRCVICLEDFVEDDKIRVLPCRHPYHSHCIDPWLTENRRTCPICKRKVFIKVEARPPRNRQVSLDSITDSDDDTTPLLQQPRNAASNSNPPNTSQSNSSSRESGRINPFDRARALQTPVDQNNEQTSRSIWSYPILRLFRRRQTLSIAAPALDQINVDVENQQSSAILPSSNNISNPSLSGSFKREVHLNIPPTTAGNNNGGDGNGNNDDDDDDTDGNSSNDEDILDPHTNIYPPVNMLIADERPTGDESQSQHQECDSMFIQTPTQGGIGVVALPNANIANTELLVNTIQPNQRDPPPNQDHQRYRHGFHI